MVVDFNVTRSLISYLTSKDYGDGVGRALPCQRKRRDGYGWGGVGQHRRRTQGLWHGMAKAGAGRGTGYCSMGGIYEQHKKVARMTLTKQVPKPNGRIFA